jgi:tetratricopeptide (TPR) repeat protein
MASNEQAQNWHFVGIIRPTKKVIFSKNIVTTASPGHISIKPSRPIHSRIVQNFIIIWLNPRIDELANNDFTKSVTELRRIVNTIDIFIDTDDCIDFLTDIKEEKVFFIIPDGLVPNLVPLVHHISQIHSFYVFSDDEPQHQQWVQQWSKVKGLFNSMTSMCQTLKQDAQKCDQDSISISFVSAKDKKPTGNLDQLDPTFMYSQILKEILLTIDFDEEHIQNFANYYRENFSENAVQLNNIERFERDYDDHTPIWWYTHECCLYSLLNRALRTMEVDAIIKMGFFIHDLHHQIAELHSEQFNEHPQPFTTYRGQGLSEIDFQKLLKTQGGLISFNNFLSASKDHSVALGFARSCLADPTTVGIVFVMMIDPLIKSTPFAFINDVSFYKTENEILFSMHTVFRIGNITENYDNRRLWRVDLIQTNDNDSQLLALSERLRNEIRGPTEWDRLGKLLIKLGQFDKAKELYEVLLEQTCSEHQKACFYHQLGWINKNEKNYDQAIEFYEKSLEIKYNIQSPNYSLLVKSLKEIGSVYEKMNQYAKALLHYEKGLAIELQTSPTDHFSLAFCYSNIGSVYEKTGEYEKALSFHEKAIEIRQQLRPSSDLTLSYSYNNIGSVYEKMGEYSKALSSLEKALEIQRTTLPANHPDVAQTYSSIGFVYSKMCEYSRAREFHQQAVDIGQRSLPNNHRRLQQWRKNLEIVKRKCE